MNDPAFWRDLQLQFRELRRFTSGDKPLVAGTADDDSWGLSGGPTDRARQASLQNQFQALASRGAIATRARRESALEAWLNLLRQRCPHLFSTITAESVRNVVTGPRDLPVAQIDLPAADVGVTQEDQQSRMIVVDPIDDGRYVVVAGHGRYAADVSSGKQSVSCLIRETTDLVNVESGWIDDVCLASAELCVELETEAFVRQHEANDGVASAKKEHLEETSPDASDRMNASDTLDLGHEAEINRRRGIFNEYVAATGFEKVRPICRAAGVHHPEFYAWSNGKLSRQSKTAKKIERFLIAKKRLPARDEE